MGWGGGGRGGTGVGAGAGGGGQGEGGVHGGSGAGKVAEGWGGGGGSKWAGWLSKNILYIFSLTSGLTASLFGHFFLAENCIEITWTNVSSGSKMGDRQCSQMLQFIE